MMTFGTWLNGWRSKAAINEPLHQLSSQNNVSGYEWTKSGQLFSLQGRACATDGRGEGARQLIGTSLLHFSPLCQDSSILAPWLGGIERYTTWPERVWSLQTRKTTLLNKQGAQRVNVSLCSSLTFSPDLHSKAALLTCTARAKKGQERRESGKSACGAHTQCTHRDTHTCHCAGQWHNKSAAHNKNQNKRRLRGHDCDCRSPPSVWARSSDQCEVHASDFIGQRRKVGFSH